MKFGDDTYCDKCHLIIAPRDPGRLDYGNVHYHAACYVKYRRANVRETALMLMLLALIAFNAKADAHPQPKPTYAASLHAAHQ